jgi:hypothetical protein
MAVSQTLAVIDSQSTTMFWLNSFREKFVGRDLSLFVALLFKLLV